MSDQISTSQNITDQNTYRIYTKTVGFKKGIMVGGASRVEKF